MSTVAPTIKERPILFAGPMVRAILAGRKTQTRRIVKPQPTVDPDGSIRFPWATFFSGGNVHTWGRDGTGGQNWNASEYPDENKFNAALRRTPYADPSPYGVPGDRLWVRESLAETYGGLTHYLADGTTVKRDGELVDMPWDYPKEIRPSIHMPRWASRLYLAIVSVRIERVQEISRGDAMAEGCPISNMAAGPSPCRWYRQLWNTINGPGSWESNPWVWAVSFKRIEQPAPAA